MNVFGIGGMELVLVLIIMLVVAGPKRMIRWAYILGQYTAKLRAMWDETVTYLQKEIDDAGLDLQLPKEPPTRQNLNREINKQVTKAMNPITQPVKESLDEVDKVRKLTAKSALTTAASTKIGNGATEPASTDESTAQPAPEIQPATRPDFGAWSGSSDDDAANKKNAS